MGVQKEELNYILHELPADWADLFAEGGAEHHHLLLMRSHTENLLHITPHIWREKELPELFHSKCKNDMIK